MESDSGNVFGYCSPQFLSSKHIFFVVPNFVNRFIALNSWRHNITYAKVSAFRIIMGKPKGIRTARKLKMHRQEQRWNDKRYKKTNLGTRWKVDSL
jgi:hypothetical protein